MCFTKEENCPSYEGLCLDRVVLSKAVLLNTFLGYVKVVNMKKNKKIIKNLIRDCGYKTQVEVIEKALALLWKHEKDLAYKDLNEKRVAFYKENPEEAEFNAKLAES